MLSKTVFNSKLEKIFCQNTTVEWMSCNKVLSTVYFSGLKQYFFSPQKHSSLYEEHGSLDNSINPFVHNVVTLIQGVHYKVIICNSNN